MKDTRDVRLKVGDPGELLAVIPYLLGFHPSESVVALVLERGVVRVSARWDICDAPEAWVSFRAQLARLLGRYDHPALTLVVYSRDADHAKAVLLTGSLAAPAWPVLGIAYDGLFWWSHDELDGPGVATPAGTAPIAAAAVFHGLQALPRRRDLAAAYDPASLVDDEGPERARLRCSLRGLNEADRVAELDALSATGPSAAVESLVRAGMIVGDERAWTHAWRGLSQADAAAQQQLWRAVLRHVHPADSPPVYALLGISCWLGGDGAAASICLEKGRRHSISDPRGLDLLALLIDTALPPELYPDTAPGHREER